MIHNIYVQLMDFFLHSSEPELVYGMIFLLLCAWYCYIDFLGFLFKITGFSDYLYKNGSKFRNKIPDKIAKFFGIEKDPK